MEFLTRRPEQTEKLGSQLAKQLVPGDCLCLTGDLGAGKTTFVHGIGKGLGIKGKMPSPTFVLAREYPEACFFHLDLYRIDSRQFLESGLNQYISAEKICAIEWAEKIMKFWPAKHILVKFAMVGEGARKINILPSGRDLKLDFKE